MEQKKPHRALDDLLKDGKPKQAVLMGERFLQERPALANHQFFLQQLGKAYFRTGDHLKAKVVYDLLTKRFPDHTAGYWGLGALALAKGDLVAAEAAARRSLALDPEHRSSYLQLADIGFKQTDPQARDRFVTEAIEGLLSQREPTTITFKSIISIMAQLPQGDALRAVLGKRISQSLDVFQREGKISEATLTKLQLDFGNESSHRLCGGERIYGGTLVPVNQLSAEVSNWK